jgi:predicted dehydrogenase
MSRSEPVRWGILGPGNIARDFMAGATGSSTGKIVALGARDPGKAGLAESFPDICIFDGYEALIADSGVEAIYVAVPHNLHAQWAAAAADRGKHVLCEKPMGMTAVEVEAMFDAAGRAGTFMGEALMYRFHPLTARIVDLLRSNAIGEVRMIKSSFGFAFPHVDPDHRLYSPTLGGGAMLDLAGYLTSMAVLLAGCRGDEEVLVPDTVKAVAHVGRTGVDEWTSALLSFPNGILADLSCSISLRQDNVLHVMGTTGRLEVDQFWFAGGKTGGTNVMRLIRPDGSQESIAVDEPRNLYAFQFEAANHAIRSGRTEFSHPGLGARDSIANARIIDKWKEQAGA